MERIATCNMAIPWTAIPYRTVDRSIKLDVKLTDKLSLTVIWALTDCFDIVLEFETVVLMATVSTT